MPFSLRACVCSLSLLTAVMLVLQSACAQDDLPVIDNDIKEPIRVAALVEQIWKTDTGITVRAFRGGAKLTQGQLTLSGHHILLFEEQTADGIDVRAVARESPAKAVSFNDGRQTKTGPVYAVRLRSIPPLESLAIHPRTISRPDPVMHDAMRFAYPQSRAADQPVRVSLAQDTNIPPGFGAHGPVELAPSRRIQVIRRSNQPLDFKSFRTTDTIPPETVYLITGGVRVLVEGVEVEVRGQIVRPVVDLSADRVVMWMEGDSDSEGGLEGGLLQFEDRKFQVYLEGNIVIKHQRGNTVTATHAFYDANSDRAIMMNAELRAFVPQTGGQFRVRAHRLRQLSADRFHAQDAWTSTSPYGRPGYRIQASDIYVEPGPQTPWTGIDPITGRQNTGPPTWITAENTKFIVGDIPILSLPRISVPAEDPGIPIRRASAGYDSIFGLEVETVWDLTKLMSMDAPDGTKRELPDGTELELLLDYRTKRGPAAGVGGRYDFDAGGQRVNGEGKVMGQRDDGTDNLGFDRRILIPEHQMRGQAIWRHRQRYNNGLSIFGEIGYLSDRNYLEQYDEIEFDEGKDAETILGIRQDLGTWSGGILVRPQLNDFDTTTEWLPRGDLYNFSTPLFGGAAYWSSHSSAAYAHLRPTVQPTDPNDPFSAGLLGTPYIRNAEGVVAMTRHQLDAPFMLGPVNINPYVMGEAAFWDQGMVQQDISRFLANAGVQASLSATKVMPFVRSQLFNLNGLAHKSQLMAEFSVTDSTRGIDEIVQYNEFDENSQERLRNRAVLQIFPGLVPDEFDPRSYAIRQGAGMWVSAPYHELADDQQVVRLRWRNRLQTKAGPMNSPRIRDWMLWETGVSYFPESQRDNFGEELGLLYGNYRWNINDRTSILADGVWDFFENRQNYWNVGLLSQRSTRGSVYLAYRQVEAHNFLDSQIVTASYSYQMSPKWISTAAYAFDIAQNESRGSSLTFIRVGLDFIFHMGLGFDTSKDNVGVAFSIEPRFGPPSPTNLSNLLGLQRL